MPVAKARRERAGLPANLGFETKHELGREMSKAAAVRGQLPSLWVMADAAYGDSHELLALSFLKTVQRHWWQRRDRSHSSGDPPTAGSNAATPHLDTANALAGTAATA